MRTTGMVTGGDLVVTRVSTRMAPAPGPRTTSSARTTFAVGSLTRRSAEIRVVEARSATRAPRHSRSAGTDDRTDTVH